MPTPNLEKRKVRLQKVLEPICQRSEFTSTEIREVCEETSAFVSQVLRQLTEDGHLVCDDHGREQRFRWHTSHQEFSPHLWISKQVIGKQILASPEEDRPRERLLRVGVADLRTAELLAILIRVGRKGESALDAGEKIANQFKDKIHQLRGTSLEDLKAISSAVSSAAFCQIQAGIELGRRISEAMLIDTDDATKIDSTSAAIEYCRKKFNRLAHDRHQEEFHIVTLDTKLFPIGHHQITVGTLDASLVHPREVFRAAIRDAASAILLLHNHPSGDPTPSREDHQVTERLKKCAEIVGIRILDHIIVASKGCVSLAENA